MFRLLRWAYDMGVRQERQRIKLVIQNEFLHYRNQSEQIDLEMRYGTPDKEKRDRLDRQLAIRQEVAQILSQVTQPRGEWIETAGAPIDKEDQ